MFRLCPEIPQILSEKLRCNVVTLEKPWEEEHLEKGVSLGSRFGKKGLAGRGHIEEGL